MKYSLVNWPSRKLDKVTWIHDLKLNIVRNGIRKGMPFLEIGGKMGRTGVNTVKSLCAVCFCLGSRKDKQRKLLMV